MEPGAGQTSGPGGTSDPGAVPSPDGTSSPDETSGPGGTTDPGRMSRPGRMSNTWRFGVPVAALLAGLLFATSANTSKGVDLRVTGRDDVNTLAAREQHTVIAQGKQLAALEKEVQAATSEAAKTDTRVAQARDDANAIADAAGLVPVTGPALTVALNDAPPLPGAQKGSVPPDYLVVHQQDVQAVVNALWAGGAEAMTLQGQRVISTSAVRCVGNTLLLQGVVYSPPYVVTAIGDQDRLQAALDAAPDVVIYKEYVDAYKLGFKVTRESKVTMPAYTGGLTLEHASAIPQSQLPASAPARTPSAPVAPQSVAPQSGAPAQPPAATAPTKP